MDASNFDNITVEELADLDLFKKWVYQSTPQQQQYWDDLLATKPVLKEKALQARQLLLALDQYYQQELPDRAAPDPKFVDKLSATLLANKSKHDARISRRKLLRRWSVAAAIAFLVGLGTWWLNPMQEQRAWITHRTDFGEWKKLTLPDGSLVHMNANSELRLQEGWVPGATREVWLKGEAYFEVAKKVQTNAKFQVNTPALKIEVLGTMFNVKSKGENTKVYLEEGKIKLKTKVESIDLAPKDFIDYTKGGSKLVVQKLKTAPKSTSWKEGTLFLSQQSVKAILERLVEIYGFSYQVDQESLLSEIKTVALPMNQLTLVIPILEKTFDASIDLHGNELIIKVD